MSEIIKLWSDGWLGGCRNNQCVNNNVGAYAYHLEYWVDGKLIHEKSYSEGEKNTTNNIQEIKGCLFGLKAIKDKTIKVEVYLDSAYTLNGITQWIDEWKRKGWINSKKEPVKNKELWIALDNEKSKFRNIEFIKVKGHANDEGNILVDSLLNKCIDEMIKEN